MTELKEGDYVEWRYGRTAFRVDTILKTDDPANDKAQISCPLDETKRKVYTVSVVELHPISSEFADKVLAINDAMVKEDNEHEERKSSLRRQWMDQWDAIHAAREKSR